MFEAHKARLYRLLRWSERYTKLDMVYFASGSFWITLGQVMSSLLSLILIIAFANLLPKETYGTYRYILSLAGIFNIFALTGMNSAVSRAVAMGQEGALRASVRYQLKWNLLMFTAFLLGAGYYFMRGDMIFATSFLMLGIFVPPTLALNTYGSYLEGMRRFNLASIATIASTAFYTGGMLVTLFYGAGLLWLIFTYAATTFGATLFYYLYVLRKFHPPVGSPEDTLRYGRHLTFISFLDPISSQIDKIILTQFWGPAQLAVYSLAMAVPARATTMIKNVVGVGSPKFAQKTPEEINKVFYLRILQGMGVGFLAFIGYVLVAPYVFAYVLPQYLDALPYSQFLALAFIFAIPNRFVSLLLVAQKLPRAILANNVILSILRIMLYILLGAWGGIVGLVVAFVGLSFVGMLVNIVIWRRATRTTAQQLF